MESDARTEKLALIQKWVDEAEQVPLHDIRWLLDEVKGQDVKAAEAEKASSELKSALIKAGVSNQACRHALTMWLAVRGSNSEEFFAATKALAAQTTKALND